MNREHLSNPGSRRISHVIKRRPAVNAHHAQRYAEMVGLPMRLFVTINFSLLGVDPNLAVAIFRTLLCERFAPWLRRTALNDIKLVPTYIWVAERGGGHLAVHWLLHMPPQLASRFRQKVALWLSGLTGQSPDERAVNIKPVTNVIGLRRYMLKGTEPVWAKHLGVLHRDQGIVVGKRSGFSRNLGPTARTKAGYKPKRLPWQSAAA